MKKIIILFIGLIGLGLLFSCEKQETDPVLDMSQATAPAIASPQSGAAFVFTEDMADEMFTMSWNAATYNLSDLEATNYSVIADLADSAFTTSKEWVSTTEISNSVTVGAMNSFLIGLGVEAGTATDVVFKINAYVNANNNVTAQESGVVTLNFTTYESVVTTFAALYVPGDYQGWNPGEAPKIYDFDGDGVYTGFIFFPEGGTFEFKFTSDPDWDHTNYGYAADGVLDTDAGAGNLSVPGAGGYHFEVDINALTWTQSDPEFWGVIGEWLAWAEDIDLEWYHDAATDAQYLTVTVPNIPAADNQRFKYRANDAWDINLGDDDLDGFMNPGGADIPIPDGGTITFYLDYTKGPDPFYWIETK